MRTTYRSHLSTATLLAAILGFAAGGCSPSETAADGTDKTTDGDRSSGGARPNTSRAASASTDAEGGAEQSATGGTSGNTRTATSSAAKSGSGGSKSSGGATKGVGGSSNGASASSSSPGGKTGSSETNAGGRSSSVGGSGKGGTSESSGSIGGTGAAKSGTGGTTGATTATKPNTSVNTGTCTASKPANSNASGSGPHKVTVETNSDSGIKEGTIYRPTDLGGDEKYPIFVWGEGGCSQNGLSNSAAMAEIASYGYFVVADGTPGGSSSRNMDSSNPTAMGKPLLAYIDWAIAENDKPCSAYYQSLDTTKIAANGFSCGGLMAEGTAGDPRMTTWGITSSGLFSANQALYKSVHTPVLIVLGGPSDIAYENGIRDYDNISALDVPIMLFSKDIGHGGDLSRANGDFTKINLAWLNWWLKGDETAKGKGLLVGSGCTYCTNSAWEVKSKNIP